MNRIHPGTPPSKRRNWDGDWRERLRTTTRSLAIKLKEVMGYDDPTTRRLIVASVRMAINEDGQAPRDRPADPDAPEGWAEVLITTARVFRAILDGDGFNRKDPIAVESFMAEIQVALDNEMGLGWRSKARKMTAGMASAMIKDPGRDPAELRATILEAAREALSDKPLEEMSRMLEVPVSEACPSGIEPLLTTSGAYRMILDCERLDRRDPGVAESFMTVVVDALDQELGAA